MTSDVPGVSLERRLGVWSAAAILIGSTIGSGIFRVPSIAAAETESLGSIALLWMLGAAIALFGVLTVAELATMYPRAGGIFVYLREACGPMPAFMYGWTRLFLIQPAVLGAIAMIFAAYVGAFTPLTDLQIRIIAVIAMVVLAAANYRSLAWRALIQNASAGAKVVALIGLGLAAFLFGNSSGALTSAATLTPAS